MKANKIKAWRKKRGKKVTEILTEISDTVFVKKGAAEMECL